MVRIIDSYRRPSPIAAAVKSAAGQLFGDTLTPELRREQLYAAQNKNDAVDRLAQTLGPVAGDAIWAGRDPGKINLFHASQQPGVDIFSPEFSANQAGAGMSASSTGAAFQKNFDQDAAIEAARQRQQQQQFNAEQFRLQKQTEAKLAQQQGQFNSGLVEAIDPATGQPIYTTRKSMLDHIRERNAGGGIYDPSVPAPVVSLTQAQGSLLNGLTAEGSLSDDQNAAIVGANKKLDPGAPQRAVDRFQDSDGNAYISEDGGRTDMRTGAPIPAGAFKVGTVGNAITDPSVLTNSNTSAVNEEAMSLRNFTSQLNQTRNIALSDPTLFGPAGMLRRMGQSTVEAAQGLDALFGGSYQSAAMNAFSNVPVDPNSPVDTSWAFDPNLANIDRAARLLAYSAAGALAQQTGRGLSDQDFRQFLSVVGDPTAFFSSQQSFVAGLGMMENMVASRAINNRLSRSGDLDTQPGAPTPPPTQNGVDVNAAQDALLTGAKEAIAAGAPRDKVIERLQQMGIDPGLL